MTVFLPIFLLITAACVYLARGMAIRRGRNRGGWMLAVALFPPLILVLAVLPARDATANHHTA